MQCMETAQVRPLLHWQVNNLLKSDYSANHQRYTSRFASWHALAEPERARAPAEPHIVLYAATAWWGPITLLQVFPTATQGVGVALS